MGILGSPLAVRLLRSWCSLVLCAGLAWLVWPTSLGGDVTFLMISGTSMEPRMHTGDLVLVRRQDAYAVGDVVGFRVPEGEVGAGSVVIHRIVGGNAEAGFVTQGDNRERPDTWRPVAGDIVGQRVLLVPGLGRTLSEMRSPAALGLLAAVGTFVLVATPVPKPTRSRRTGSRPLVRS